MTPPEPEQSAPAAVPAPPGQWPTAAEASPKQRRRWSRKRTALLITVAVVLGAVGGSGVGYAIQAQRPPTPLPPIDGDALHYPSDRAPLAALPAEQDDAVRTDGDLTRLLVTAPAGARPSNATDVPDGWLTLGDFARGYKKPEGEFRWMLRHGFRRAAQVSWSQGAQDVVVTLVQFQKTNEADVKSDLQDQEGYASADCGPNPATVPGTSDSQVFAGSAQHSYSDGTTYYEGCGFARHGDVLIDVHVYDQTRISGQALMSLIQSQLERL